VKIKKQPPKWLFFSTREDFLVLRYAQNSPSLKIIPPTPRKSKHI
jgi:hypothetical protein